MTEIHEWRKMQVYGMWLWHVRGDTDPKVWKSIPEAAWDHVSMVPGTGKETRPQLEEWAMREVKERELRGVFVAAIGRGENFDAFRFEA